MENKNTGIYFNVEDVKAIVEKHVNWTEVVTDQVICVQGVMDDETPIGASIIVGIDGIKCENGSNILKLVASNGIYELNVQTTMPNDTISIRFKNTVSIHGTFGQMVDGVLDILTDEEKEFSQTVNELLGDRDDEFAAAFRADNTREIGGRGLILLEKIKTEIKNDGILSADNVTPIQLTSVFIEMTKKYIEATKNIEDLNARHDEVLAQYHDTYDENSKQTKRLARDVDVINKSLDANQKISSFCVATIESAIKPMLNSVVER